MGFFNFGRKSIEPEVVAVGDFGFWVLSEKKRLVSQENDFFQVGDKMISDLIKDIGGRIDVLEKIDLKGKKEVERIKMIVLQNLESYIFYVKKFMKDIEGLEKTSVSEFVDGVEFVFSDFWSRASKHYERATILIGDELGDTRKIMDGFFRDFGKFALDNKSFIERVRVVCGAEKSLEKTREIEVAKIEAERELSRVLKKIGVLEGDVVKIREKAQAVRGSAEYLERVEKIRGVKMIREGIVSDKVEIVRLVDYKSLIGFFHKDAKKMDLIKMYRDSGADALVLDKGREVALLLEGAGLETEGFLVKVGEIVQKEKKLDEVDVGADKVRDLGLKVDGILREIDGLKKDEVGAIAIVQKLEGHVLEVLEELKALLKGIGIEVSD